jgi:hypothetical protein
MTQQYSTLSILISDCRSFNIINCLQSAVSALDENNHCLVVLSCSGSRCISTQEKINQVINKTYINNLNNKTLTIIVDNNLSLFKSSNLELYKKYPNLLKYDWFVEINTKVTYVSNFLSNIISTIGKHTGVKKITVDNHNANHSAISIYRKDLLVQLLNTKNIAALSIPDSYKTSSDFILQTSDSSQTTSVDSAYIDDPNFTLFWIEEDEGSVLRNGYCFLYKKNNKIFNINNECHGILNHIFDNSITINWFLPNDTTLKKTYYQKNQNSFYSCEK